MNRLKKGDEVIVIAGKDKGKRGSVSKVLANGRVVVDGINLVKKHVKANPMTGEQGGIITKEAPIHASNVMLLIRRQGRVIGLAFEWKATERSATSSPPARP